jgi:hypothetical protein
MAAYRMDCRMGYSLVNRVKKRNTPERYIPAANMPSPPLFFFRNAADAAAIDSMIEIQDRISIEYSIKPPYLPDTLRHITSIYNPNRL